MDQSTVDTIKKIRNAIALGVFCRVESDHDVRELSLTHPKLYNMVKSKDCDSIMLKSLLDLQVQIGTGKLSQPLADQQFGEVAAQKYVNNLIE